MLLPDLNTYITMRMDEEQFNTFEKAKKHMLKFVKVQANQKKTAATVASKGGVINMVEGEWEPLSGAAGEPDTGAETDWLQQQSEILEELRQSGADESTQVAVLAVMRGRFQKKFGKRFGGGTGGGGGQRGNTQRAPPRGIQDMSCINCGEKGNVAADCTKTLV